MTASIIAVDFRARHRVPVITLQTPPSAAAEQEALTTRRVRQICAQRGVPASEHDFIVNRALQRLRHGDSPGCVHAWAREFATDLVAALRARGPDDAA